MKNKHLPDFGLDSLAEAIASLGIAGYAFVIICGATGYVGAASISAGLSTLGPAGMIGGVISFGALALIIKGVLKYGAEELSAAVYKKLRTKGKSKVELLQEVDRLPFSKSYKERVKAAIQSVEE